MSDCSHRSLNHESADIVYEHETYGELMPGVKHEWLLTNGIGGYASGTVAGVNTRRYHGALVAATLPPVGRMMMLSRWMEMLHVDEDRVDLSGAFFNGELLGDGPALLRRFTLQNETAAWEYDIEGTTVLKELFVCWGINASAVRYTVTPGSIHRGRSLRLRVMPFIALRDFHALPSADGRAFDVRGDTSGVRVCLPNLSLRVGIHPPTTNAEKSVHFDENPDWWHSYTYPMETARGLDDREDLFTPGSFRLNLPNDNDRHSIVLWAREGDDDSVLDWDAEHERRRRGLKLRPMPTPAQRKLVRAAADFVVKRHHTDGTPGTTILAGYPWFSDWGRDTFIALPGLLLTTGRHETAGEVLSTFARYVSEGMIPNRFDDYTNEPSYNTVDASLWFINAAHSYLTATKDGDTYERILRPACEAIIEGYRQGTRFNIGVDPADGLVGSGDETTQLTWMDVKYEGVVATPRHGKAVEINALWYNALRLLGHDDEAARTRESFHRAFWLDDGRGLADVVRGAPGSYEVDDALRPNQIFTVSLEYSPLERSEQKIVVDVVRRALLTPFGLRTLSRDHEKYIARYTGPMRERDRAYHNGTVWPWLMGPFIDAHLKVHDRSPRAIDRARTWLRPLLDHLSNEGCLGNVCEVFDAEHPYRPGGCFAQAWSVAEVLRLAVELEL